MFTLTQKDAYRIIVGSDTKSDNVIGSDPMSTVWATCLLSFLTSINKPVYETFHRNQGCFKKADLCNLS